MTNLINAIQSATGPSRELDIALSSSAILLRDAIAEFQPTHIVSMVSGGKDSAASDAIARELGIKIDLVMHGNTRCGIPQTSLRDRDWETIWVG